MNVKKQNITTKNEDQYIQSQSFNFSLLKKITPKNQTEDLKIGIVQSRFNEKICSDLSTVCLNRLVEKKIEPKNITFASVAGALEIPIVLKQLAKQQFFDVLIAIGTIIRGETYHFDIVANESARCISNLALELNIPIVNTILTTENEEQALVRIVEKAKDAADIAIEMANLMKEIILQK